LGQSAEWRVNTDIVVEAMGSAIAMSVCTPSAILQQNDLLENRDALITVGEHAYV
jgi:hypothetical protein